MTRSASEVGSSFLLWALGALVVMLAAHVLLGWVRQAQELSGRRRIGAVVIGAACFGLALNLGATLALQSEGLSLLLGYRPAAAAALFIGGAVVLVPLFLLPAFSPGVMSALPTGLALGAAIVGVQAGWIAAAGFKPGPSWRGDLLLTGWLAAALCVAVAFTLAFPAGPFRQHFRYAWRLAGAAFIALAFLVGSTFVIAAAGLGSQNGSTHGNGLSGTLLALVGGTLGPLVLVVLCIDVELRRHHRRRKLRDRHHLASRIDSRWGTSIAPELPPDLPPATHA